VVDTGFALVLAREREHVVGHVEAVDLAGRTHATGREQHIDAAARSEIEHSLADLQLNQRCRVAAAERRSDHGVGPRAALAVAVEVLRDLFGPAAAGARAAASLLRA